MPTTVIPGKKPYFTHSDVPGTVPWRDSSGIPEGWLPVDIGGPHSIIRWMQVGANPLSEPFFEGTVGFLRAQTPRPFEFESELQMLDEVGRAVGRPSGIILHISRCGSTLLLNALRAAEATVCVSEARSLDALARMASSPSRHWAKIGKCRLAQAITVFSRYLGAPDRSVILKCGHSGIFCMRALREVWPDVPFLILARDPVEVLVSNLERPPRWLYEGHSNPERLPAARPPAEVLAEGATSFCAWVLGRFCIEALSAWDEGCSFLDYEDLNPEVIATVAEHWGLRLSRGSTLGPTKAFEAHSKNRHQPFTSDSQAKQRAATVAIRRAAELYADGPYRALRQHTDVARRHLTPGGRVSDAAHL